MTNNMEEKQTAITKKMMKVQLLGAPGSILFGLGLYGVFAVNGDAFIDFLNDPRNCYAMIGVGGAIMLWEAYAIFKLARQRKALKNVD
ncbi:hypothetical protein [Pseudoalteromonas sp. GB56]